MLSGFNFVSASLCKSDGSVDCSATGAWDCMENHAPAPTARTRTMIAGIFHLIPDEAPVLLAIAATLAGTAAGAGAGTAGFVTVSFFSSAFGADALSTLCAIVASDFGRTVGFWIVFVSPSRSSRGSLIFCSGGRLKASIAASGAFFSSAVAAASKLIP